MHHGYAPMNRLTLFTLHSPKMKKNLVYQCLTDEMYMAPDGLMKYRIQEVEFTKEVGQIGRLGIKELARHETRAWIERNPSPCRCLTGM